MIQHIGLCALSRSNSIVPRIATIGLSLPCPCTYLCTVDFLRLPQYYSDLGGCLKGLYCMLTYMPPSQTESSMTDADLSASISASLRAASTASGSAPSSSLASSQVLLRRLVDTTAAPSSPVSLAACHSYSPHVTAQITFIVGCHVETGL